MSSVKVKLPRSTKAKELRFDGQLKLSDALKEVGVSAKASVRVRGEGITGDTEVRPEAYDTFMLSDGDEVTVGNHFAGGR